MLLFLLLLLFGAMGGFIGGLAGLGGGIIFILILPWALTSIGVPADLLPRYVVANSLFATMVSAAATQVTHYRNRNFFPRAAFFTGIAAIVTALIVLKFVLYSSWYSKTVFNWVIIIILIMMWARSLLKTNYHAKNAEADKMPAYKMMFVGMLSGSIGPLSGLGGGIVIIPMLNTFYDIPIRVASSVSLGAVAINSAGASIINLINEVQFRPEYAHFGLIIWPVALGLSIGAMATSWLGVKTAKKLSPKALNIIFTTIMLISILMKAYELIIG